MLVKLNEIHASTRVRKSLDTEKLDELADSFGEIGQLCPILLRPNDDGYQVVFGHRRVDAARQNGEVEIEAVVRELDDRQTLVAALAENIVREDMAPIDIAKTLKQLKDTTNWTNEEIGRRFGWTERTIRKYVRMLDYEISIQSATRPITHQHVDQARTGTGGDKKLTEKVLKKAADEGLSMRQTRRVAEEVKRASDFDGEKGVKATLKKPYEEIGKTWLKKHTPRPIVDKVEGEIVFEWLKQPEVLEVEQALKLASRVMALMAKKKEDVGSAKYILKQWSNIFNNLHNQADDVERTLR